MKKLLIIACVFFLCGCTMGIQYRYDSDGKTISKNPHFSMLQMQTADQAASAQSTVGIGFSLKFTDQSSPLPKLDLGYFRHSSTLVPVVTKARRIANVVIGTRVNATGEGISDAIVTGNAAEEYLMTPTSANASMFELMIDSLKGKTGNAEVDMKTAEEKTKQLEQLMKLLEYRKANPTGGGQ